MVAKHDQHLNQKCKKLSSNTTTVLTYQCNTHKIRSVDVVRSNLLSIRSVQMANRKNAALPVARARR